MPLRGTGFEPGFWRSDLVLDCVGKRHTCQRIELNRESVGQRVRPLYPERTLSTSPMDITELQMLYAAGQRDFHHLDLESAELICINLQGACLSRANLRHANLRWANLSQTNLTWADLRGADLSWANLDGADLEFAHLKGAKMPDGTIHD
jgi:hypothetical protein